MSFSSFFQPKASDVTNSQHKSFGEYLFDTFNWLYERSPVNFSTITGMYHPSVQRLIGNPLLGRAYLSFGFDPNY